MPYLTTSSFLFIFQESKYYFLQTLVWKVHLLCLYVWVIESLSKCLSLWLRGRMSGHSFVQIFLCFCEIISHMKVFLASFFMHMWLFKLMLSVWQLVTVISEGKASGARCLRALNVFAISQNKYVHYLIKAAVVITVISSLFPRGCLCQLWSNYWNKQTSTVTPTGQQWPQGSPWNWCV